MSTPEVLIVEDDDNLREALAMTLSMSGFKNITANNGKEALHMIEKCQPRLIISDVNMPEMNGLMLLEKIRKTFPAIPVLLVTAYGTIKDAVYALQHGAIDYIQKPFLPQNLIEKLKEILEDEINISNQPIAVDAKSKQIYALAKKVANSDASILITGPSGAGKEVLAKYIHNQSQRKDKPFIAINCAAIPDQMLEATLFGHEKGSFTGALASYAGKFEQAQEGTLLLDEISEMDINLQAKLLRVLQEKEVERLGGKKVIKLNVRLIATTNRNFIQYVNEGKFREDLYYRLNVFPLHLLPLSERREDIIPLANYLLSKHSEEMHRLTPKLSKEVQTTLLNYNWPGNVREMDNVLHRALLLQSENIIYLQDISIATDVKQEDKSDVITIEFNQIYEALLKNFGNRKKTSEQLGISERTLRYKLAKMRQMGIVC